MGEQVSFLSPLFKYTNQNPYHQRLQQFQDFVYLGNDPEAFRGIWRDQFDLPKPIALEIGPGKGEFLLFQSQLHKEYNYLGIDFRFKRSFHLAQKIKQLSPSNLKFLRAKAERLPFIFAPGEVAQIFYFFPDPWPKTRHHKKRLFQRPYLEQIAELLQVQGKLWIKTDHQPYFLEMMNCISQLPQFNILYQTTSLYEQSISHPFLSSFQTHFEKLFLTQRKPICAAEVIRSS